MPLHSEAMGNPMMPNRYSPISRVIENVIS